MTTATRSKSSQCSLASVMFFPGGAGIARTDFVIEAQPVMPFERGLDRRDQHLVAIRLRHPPLDDETHDILGKPLDDLDHRLLLKFTDEAHRRPAQPSVPGARDVLVSLSLENFTMKSKSMTCASPRWFQTVRRWS